MVVLRLRIPTSNDDKVRPRISPHIVAAVLEKNNYKNKNGRRNKRGGPAWQKGKSANPKGRPNGSKNKNTLMAQAQAQAAATGVLPLQFMLGVMRDVGQEIDIRLQAATAAAPYLHKKQPIGIEQIPGRFGALTADQLRQLPTPALQQLRIASRTFYKQLVNLGIAQPEGEVIDVTPSA